jgi:hypothetical protein
MLLSLPALVVFVAVETPFHLPAITGLRASGDRCHDDLEQ